MTTKNGINTTDLVGAIRHRARLTSAIVSLSTLLFFAGLGLLLDHCLHTSPRFTISGLVLALITTYLAIIFISYRSEKNKKTHGSHRS
jgi:F0F1-type ATP synthase assembly protein I